MSDFPWLPVGFDLGNGAASGRLLGQGPGYQLVGDRNGSGGVLLIDPEEMPDSPARERLMARATGLTFGAIRLWSVPFSATSEPLRVGDIERRIAGITDPVLLELTRCLRRLQSETPDAAWEDALFVRTETADCLPTSLRPDIGRRRSLLVRIMTGGIDDAGLSAVQIKRHAAGLSLQAIEDMLGLCEVRGPKPRAETRAAAGAFDLPGQATFARIVNEYIVDPARDPDRYRAMGVKMPNGILLHGPRGTGKTYALKKLAEFLSWNTVETSLGSVGGTFIHETSMKLRELFSRAEEKAPTILVINEIDALAARRAPSSHDHKIEEVNEFLLLIETAGARGILVAATTNRPDSIDSAFLRKGRFDLQVEIGYPDAQQVAEMLSALLRDRPHAAHLNLDLVARELGARPASDLDWTVNEAARLAVRSGKDAIDDICLFEAVNRLNSRLV